MTLQEAHRTLAGPLKFGDPAQIEAHKVLIADAEKEDECATCAGSGECTHCDGTGECGDCEGAGKVKE
jgi:DnaJ-class molecular chaperone